MSELVAAAAHGTREFGPAVAALMVALANRRRLQRLAEKVEG